MERGKNDRQKKKKLITDTLTTVVSRNQQDKMVDQSTKVIGKMSQPVARRGYEDEEEEADDWFDDDSDNANDDPIKYLNALGR